jgi:hypothetical protein
MSAKLKNPRSSGVGISQHDVSLLVPCTNRKSVQPALDARAVSVPRSSQRRFETAWLERLETLPTERPAKLMYSGRGFQLAKQSASATNGALYIVSAGLGLVAADRLIPSYGITVSGNGPESVGGRIAGRFNQNSWWRAVSGGPYATPLKDVFVQRPRGVVVVALTQPYAEMLSSALDELADSDIARLRVVGTKLERILPCRIAPNVLPYDERLDAIFPGTRGDFPHRALSHFVSQGLVDLPLADLTTHKKWVQIALAKEKAPERPDRPRLSDEAIVEIIEKHILKTRGIARMLRVLRDEEGVACEQARFTRLYRATFERVSVS